MKRSSVLLLVLVAVVSFSVLWFISVRNSLVRKEEGIKGGWAQVQNVYQRRLDLVPNLVNTVKGYAKHEQQTLENVVEARGKALQSTAQVTLSDPAKFAEFEKAQAGLSSALSRLLAVVEAYPDLKASQNFRDLQVALEGTENRIAVERRRFNELTQDYNAYIRLFPQSLVAGVSGFQAKPYFQAAPGAETAPRVEF